jgi:hypothetical protein
MAKPKKKYSFILIGVLLIFLIVIKSFKSCIHFSSQNDFNNDSLNYKNEWRYHPLVFTKHARCRMFCRNISESEVKEIQHNGKINYSKSHSEDKPCASYAVEGDTPDGQHVRIVFGACEKETTVITCIDLETEHTCNCN